MGRDGGIEKKKWRESGIWEPLLWTLLTRAVKVFSSIQTCGLVEVNQMFPWFSRVFQEKILSPFLEHLEENVGV